MQNLPINILIILIQAKCRIFNKYIDTHIDI